MLLFLQLTWKNRHAVDVFSNSNFTSSKNDVLLEVHSIILLELVTAPL
jgi:hypothetical protein